VSLRLEMLQVARLAPRLLSEGADLVREFIAGQLHPDGGFFDRAGNPDLYYTVFGLNCMLAMRMEIPYARISAHLETFGDGRELDLIHLSALARAWATLPGGISPQRVGVMLEHLETWRTPKGGYNVTPDAKAGTAYGNFMALGTYQDLNRPLPQPQQLIEGCLALRTPDGGFANEPDIPAANTPAMAAVESVLRSLGESLPEGAAQWLLKYRYPEGGFFAVPGAPMPDLLSTATALHALSGMGVDLEPLCEANLDYIDSLWVNKGSFYGNWGDGDLDVEYTFYGLLALGHLSAVTG